MALNGAQFRQPHDKIQSRSCNPCSGGKAGIGYELVEQGLGSMRFEDIEMLGFRRFIIHVRPPIECVRQHLYRPSQPKSRLRSRSPTSAP